jgi:hypothetical protein
MLVGMSIRPVLGGYIHKKSMLARTQDSLRTQGSSPLGSWPNGPREPSARYHRQLTDVPLLLCVEFPLTNAR